MTEHSKAQTSALHKLAGFRDELAKLDKATKAAQRKRDEWIVRAVEAGVRPAEVARVAGVSRGRVSQISPVPKAAQTRVYAQKNDVGASGVTPPDTCPSLPDTSAPLLSGVATVRQRRPYGRRTMFRAPGPVPAILADALQAEAGRVYLTGRRPADPDAPTTIAEQVRGWALSDPGPEWESESHYLADPDLPVLRFRHSSGHRVTVMRAASWWGETDADVATCEAAWSGLESLLERVPAFAGAGLADTPATTGRALWLRTIPEGRSYPVMSAELRELIAATSGQGRIELRPAPFLDLHELTGGKRIGRMQARSRRWPQHEPAQDFTYLDGRFMYAALTWGMPIGEPTRWTGAAVDGLDAASLQRTLRGRGRWRVTYTVPDGWAHVGMFGRQDAAGAWSYPCEPGETFTTWADGSEVWAGMVHGWEPTFHEGITWAEGKPLDTWRDALVGVWEQANASNQPAAKLGARAVRSILLFALGAFAARAHPVTATVPADRPDQVPAGVEVRRVGDRLMWTEPGKLSAWSEATAHPEWSATVWARARTRLLTGSGGVGALHIPVDRVVAFATDALYLAGGAPAWPDDGKPGRFRVKGLRPGPFDWPETYPDLYRLRDESEANA